MQLILASSSPRRSALLEQLGIDPIVRPSDVDETPRPGEAPDEYVERLARAKAAAADPDGAVVVAADTIVTIDGELLGKPRSAAEARAHLRRLSGREHEVLTGLAVRTEGAEAAGVESTRVTFAALDESDIAWYVATGEPTDKAGSYAIQGAGGLFVSEIDGSFDNVIGLPRRLLRCLVAELGVDLLHFSSRAQGSS